MTYEPTHSAQAQSVRVTKKYILVLLVTIVATLEEVKINVYLKVKINVYLLRKYTYLFLERGIKSNNVWLRALMQSDCLYSSLFFEHYNRILLCE